VRPGRRPELTTLAQTIDAWWPQVLGFLETGITNAGTEGVNRLIKDTTRAAFGFRNLDHQAAGYVPLHTTPANGVSQREGAAPSIR
jgi:transposase